MGWLSDALKFEKSHVSDLWSGIKKDPKRAILGVDPLSTAGWNAVLGREDQPLVNQLGGATEENYENAEARGINTGAGRTLHGIAGTIAGAYGAQGAGSALGGIGGGGAQPGAWEQGFAGTSGMSGAPYGSAPASGIGGIAGPVGGAGSSTAGGNMDLMRIAAMGQGMGQGPAPVSAPAGPPSAPQRMPIMGGAGATGGPRPVMTGRRAMSPAMLAQILRSGGGRVA